MASTIKIKRSLGSNQPGSLAPGELAYSGGAGGAGKLYIGMGWNSPTDTTAQSIIPIGGTYYTNLLDGTPGTWTSSKALIVGSNGKVDQINVGDITASNSRITTSTTDANLELDANGAGLVKLYPSSPTNSWTLPRSKGDDGQFLKIRSDGHSEWADVPVNLSVVSQNGSGILDLINDDFTINGDKGITTEFNDTTNVLKVSGVLATSSAIGVASFDATDFSIDTSNGGNKVSLVSERIQDIVGPMFNTGLHKNITVSYNDDSNAVDFQVDIASTSTAGIAQFDSGFFKFTTGADTQQSKVQLVGSIIKTVTVGLTDLTITDNTLRLANGTGISLTGSQGTVTISGVNATANTKGVALFGENYFDMTTAGEVKIKTATAGTDQTSQLGLSAFNTDNFTAASGFVSAKTITLGNATLSLGGAAVTDLEGLDILEAGNVHIENNKINAFGTGNDLVLQPAAGQNVKIGNTVTNDGWWLPNNRGNGTNQVLTMNTSTGYASWETPKADVSIYDSTGINPKTLTVGVSSIKFTGTQGIGTTVSKTGDQVTLEIGGVLASSSQVGVSKFNSTEFEVLTGGDVHLKDGGISVDKLADNTIQIGSTTVKLGESTNEVVGLDYSEIGNVKIGSNNQSATPQQLSTIAARSSAGGGNLYLDGNSGGKIWISSAYALPNVIGENGQSLVIDNTVPGGVRWKTPTTILRFKADNSIDSTQNITGSVDLVNGTLYFKQGIGIHTSVSDHLDEIVIDANIATYSTAGDAGLGVASFSNTFFTVTNGAVTLADAVGGKGITNAKLVNSSIVIGDQTIHLGDAAVTTLTGVTGGIEAGNIGVGLTGTSNTIKALNSNGDITFNTNGTGKIKFYGQGSNYWTIPTKAGITDGQVLTIHDNGDATWETPVTILNIAGDSGSDSNGINLIDQVLTFAGDTATGTETVISNNKVTIKGKLATDTQVGVAKFSADQFTVSGSGNVTLNTEAIQDIVGNMVVTGGNVVVYYDDPNNQLRLSVPDASYTQPGVASFHAGDFMIDSSGQVSLDDSVLKSIQVDGSTNVTPVNNAISLKGDTPQGVTVTATSSNIKVSVATTTATTLGVAKFPTAQFSLDAGAVSILNASYTQKGVASFASANFTVNSGGVTTNPVKLGNLVLNLGDDYVTDLTGLTSVVAGDITVSSNNISFTGSATNGTINIVPKGTGSIAVGNKKITNLAMPTAASDAATKEYVDGKASGLTVKDPVQLASAPDAPLTPNAHGVDSTGKVDLTYTGASGNPVIDGRTVLPNYRVLLKNQGTVDPLSPSATNDPENGIYVWTGSAWQRAADANEDTEFTAGTFLFVQDGELWADTGWVLQTLWNPTSMNLETDPLKFVQFSAAGVLKPGTGLVKEGGYFNINLDSTSGLEVNGSNILAIKSTTAGDGLTFSNGVINVVGTTNRISVTANAVDISASYVGQTSITTLGTIATGAWNGTAVGAAYGGTGQTSFNRGDLLVGNSSNGLNVLSVTGNGGKFLQVVNVGTEQSPVYDVSYQDIDGGVY